MQFRFWWLAWLVAAAAIPAHVVAGDLRETPSAIAQSAPARSVGQWLAFGEIVSLPYSSAFAVLADGRLAFFGGCCNEWSGDSTGVQVYDPAAGTLSLAGNLVTGRRWQTATPLPSGKVLIASGVDHGVVTRLHSAELYDPASGRSLLTGSLASARYSHAAALLPDGKVLVSGGCCDYDPNSPAGPNIVELYDPVSGTWSVAGSLSDARFKHTATTLPNGKVLIAGGSALSGLPAPALASAELCDPAAATCSRTGWMLTPRADHTATLLPDGRVLVVGGRAGPCWRASLVVTTPAAEIYDPATETWSSAGTLSTSRADHTATLLANGSVLIAGGLNWPECVGPGSTFLASAEIYDPLTGAWSNTASLTTARTRHVAARLSNGKVLVVGGTSDPNDLTPPARADLYTPLSFQMFGPVLHQGLDQSP